MKHLFFKKVPDSVFVDRLLSKFGVEGVNHVATFTKDDLRVRGTHESIKELIPELRNYYIPCKFNVYVASLMDDTIPVDVRVKKCITVLRQILRMHSCYILSNQVMKYGEKKVHYTLVWPDRPQQMMKHVANVVVEFV